MKKANPAKLLCTRHERELSNLRDLSAQIGSDPLLVQASNGNTSIKLGGILWIKASGKLLSDALQADSFVPLDLSQVRASIRRNLEISAHSALQGNSSPSIETAMHAVIRHRVVIHVHSINAIAWAILLDGAELLKERLAGLHWRWVPYAASGLPLAQGVESAIAERPETDVFILGNHGLVVCGHDCRSAEKLLRQVEQRLWIAPRSAPTPDAAVLEMIARFTNWRFPEEQLVHALGTDDLSLQIAKGGILYPCQAIFLGATFPLLPATISIANFSKESRDGCASSYVTFEKCGTMLGDKITPAERATLVALVEVTLRTSESTPLRYLNGAEVTHVLNDSAHSYKTEVATEKKTNFPAAVAVPADRLN